MSARTLVLYSDQVIDKNRAIDLLLLDLLDGTSKSIAYVSSSIDDAREYYQKKQEYYSRYTIELPQYFDEITLQDPINQAELFSYPAIHFSGGNTYHFRNWIFSLGLDSLLTKYSDNGGILIGTSAGAILQTPDIRCALLCGDSPTSADSNTGGLNLVNFYIWPHYTHESEFSDKTLNSIRIETRLYRIRDGSGIIVDGSGLTTIGDVT